MTLKRLKNVFEMAILKKNINVIKKMIRIWPLVGALYGPIIFWVLVINLPKVTKVDWKNFFESNKSRVTRHHQKAKEIGLPGIPYWRNSGTGSILYISEDDIAYGMCGPDFICSKELNEKKSIHFMPIHGGAKRIKSNVIYAAGRFWCDSYDIKHSGKCRSGGWVNGSER